VQNKKKFKNRKDKSKEERIRKKELKNISQRNQKLGIHI